MIRKIKYVLISKMYLFFERFLGLHITVPHFYSPLPVMRELPVDITKRVYPCVGIDFHSDEQVSLIGEFMKFKSEYVPQQNIGLSLVDAFVLYAMIRTKKPKKMVEIGSGQSTIIALKALELNASEGNNFEMISIEPYPPEHLFSIQSSRFKLVSKKVQEVDRSVFTDCDLLFIDSSHVSKINSDVNLEILEIVPEVKKGCIIHWHDIVMPGEYPDAWLRSGQQFWNESYILQAFMSFNSAFKIKWASKYLQLNRESDLAKNFVYYSKNHNLTSFWIERIA